MFAFVCVEVATLIQESVGDILTTDAWCGCPSYVVEPDSSTVKLGFVLFAY